MVDPPFQVFGRLQVQGLGFRVKDLEIKFWGLGYLGPDQSSFEWRCRYDIMVDLGSSGCSCKWSVFAKLFTSRRNKPSYLLSPPDPPCRYPAPWDVCCLVLHLRHADFLASPVGAFVVLEPQTLHIRTYPPTPLKIHM